MSLIKLARFAATTAALTLGGAAQASEIRLGLHAESAAMFESTQATAIYGLDVSSTHSFNPWLALRSKLSLDTQGEVWLTRLDETLLVGRDFYGGVGLGSGLFLTSFVTDTSHSTSNSLGPVGDQLIGSTVFLTNLHAVVGKNFGPAQLELYVRAGIMYGFGVTMNTRIR